MSSDTCAVATNLKSGLICELGLVLDYTLGRFVKTPSYKAVRLKGTQHATKIALPPGTPMLATRDLPPGLTEGVNREFITEWLRQHPNMRQHIWIVEKPADAKHIAADKPKAPFEPLDPKAPFKVGADDTVTTANFNS